MTTTLDTAVLTRALRERLPTLDVRDASPEHAIDTLAPTLVVAPASQSDVAIVLAVANDLGAAVAPRGGSTQTTLGSPPEPYDIALDLRALNALVEHEPADLTCTVEAGMRLADVQRALAAHNQWLPLDPALPDEATIGGILATNAAGPARIRYGSPRDLVIGMTVALANGDLAKSGGRVVKNVAGYDMAKLHIGALGTLGVITQATFKIAPLPVEEAFIAIDGSLDQLSALATDVIEARLPLLGLVLTKRASTSAWTLTTRLGAGESAVERSEHDLHELARTAGLTAGPITAFDYRAVTNTRAADTTSSRPPLSSQGEGSGGEVTLAVKATVPPTSLTHIAAAFADAGASVAALPGIGAIEASWTETPGLAALQALRARCETAKGALAIQLAPADMKREAGVWGATRGDFALMQRLKQQFDPNRILNPGRFLGGI
jgi:glycolate oxidase FAD binding subunit